MAMRSVLVLCTLATACGPRAHIPALPQPAAVAGAVDPNDDVALLARQLAPVLFLQRDEWFGLARVVAVVHPEKRLIGYHLLWRDDVHGSWIPFTVPTDQEIVWVGYDSARVPTDIWTFWHGKILRTDWRQRGTPLISVQWGKHGSLPHGVVESDLPGSGTLNVFYMFTWLGLPDIWLGRLTRRGPMCFCHGYGRYREFTKPLALTDRIDVVLHTEDPNPGLAQVFGRPFSKKRPWPQVE